MTRRRFALLLALPPLLLVALLFWAHAQSYRVAAHWPQPADLQYGEGDPYHFLVVEGDRDWRRFPLGLGRNYFLLIGHEILGDQDGHRTDYSFHPGAADLEAHIRNCSVEWTPAGVSFQEPSGHRLFIPKEQFVAPR